MLFLPYIKIKVPSMHILMKDTTHVFPYPLIFKTEVNTNKRQVKKNPQILKVGAERWCISNGDNILVLLL